MVEDIEKVLSMPQPEQAMEVSEPSAKPDLNVEQLTKKERLTAIKALKNGNAALLSIMQSGKLSKKELYKPPTYGELKSLEFAEKQLNAHLFSLQIGELLQELAIPYDVKKVVDAFIYNLTAYLTSMTASGNSTQLQEMIAYVESDNDLKIPFPRDLISSVSLKGSFCFIPPAKVYPCGSWKTNTSVSKIVDIAVVMAKDCFHEKDYLNYRCFFKRALFLRHLVGRLMDAGKANCKLNISSMSYSYVDGNILWPALLLKPSDSCVKSFTIRLIPLFDRSTMKLARFANNISNIRLDDCLAISLMYNQTALADLTMENTEMRIESAFGTCSTPEDDAGPSKGLINGLKLLKIWSKQRRSLISPGCGIGGYFWSIVLLHMLNMKRINAMMTPLQVFKITLQSIAEDAFCKKGPASILPFAIAPPALGEQDWTISDVVLTDASGFHNFLFRMSTWQLEKLKLLASETVKSLDAFDRFDATFLTSMPALDFYDQIWPFRLTSIEKITDSVSPKTVDALVEVKRFILDRLHCGIGRRVRCIDFIDDADDEATVAKEFSVKSPPRDCLIGNNGVNLRIGVCFNDETFMDVIDKGPPADSPEAIKFRTFWMKKSELRRFQDGSILEAVVWNEEVSSPSSPTSANKAVKEVAVVPAAERSVQSRRMICFQAASWILENHCGITANRNGLFCAESVLAGLLTPLLRKYPARKYGSGEELFLSCSATFERLTKMIKSVERNLALGFHAIQGVGPTFRFTDVFPPLPVSFDQSMTDVANDTRVPNPEKLCPPYAHANCVIIMVESTSSSAWPDDWSAFRRVRAALHVQLYRALGEEWPELPKQAGTDWIDVVLDGFVFRLKVRCQHEVNILRMVKDYRIGKTSMMDVGASKQASQLAYEVQGQPKLTSILHNLASTQSFAFSATCRLVKRWLSSQMFTDHVADDVIDVMVAYLFICPSTVPPPTSPLAGFLRFLKLLAIHDWRLMPLIVNLNDEFTHDRLNELLLDFGKNRQNYPAFAVLSPIDPISALTRDTPSVVVLNRLLILAANTYDRLSTVIMKKSPSSNLTQEISQIFTPDLSVFDVVLELDTKFLSRRHEVVNFGGFPANNNENGAVYLPKFRDASKLTSSQSTSAPVVMTTKNKKFPVVDFDMQEKLVNELKAAYGEIALYFYDRYGGSKVGVVWRPTLEREFKLVNMALSQPTVRSTLKTTENPEDDCSNKKGLGKTDQVCLTTNRSAALADFRFIGKIMKNFVRESAKFIAANAKHVSIDKNAVDRLSKNLLEVGDSHVYSLKSWKEHDLFPKVADEKAIAWIFIVDVLNFNFWNDSTDRDKCVIRYGGKEWTGYMALAAAINRAIDNGIPILDADFCATISEEDVKRVFAPDSGDEMPLMKERRQVLHEAGRVLKEKFDGSFVNCIKNANGSAQALLSIIVNNFPAFRDEVVDYCGRRVAFYKRAQILIADIWACCEGRDFGAFSDIDSITMFADYRIPQVLVHFGVLAYSNELNCLLEKSHVFKSGDAMEVEIRGCTIHAVDLLYEKMLEVKNKNNASNGAEIPLNVILIDHYLWDYRRNHAVELRSVPFHKVRCIYY